MVETPYCVNGTLDGPGNCPGQQPRVPVPQQADNLYSYWSKSWCA